MSQSSCKNQFVSECRFFACINHKVKCNSDKNTSQMHRGVQKLKRKLSPELTEYEYHALRSSYQFMYAPEIENHGIHPLIFVIVLFITIVLMFHLSAIRSSLPKALNETEIGDDAQRISGVRAMEDLVELSKIGPKPKGSYENEYLTVDLLKRKLKVIQNEAKSEWNGIDVDVQIASGAFFTVNNAKNFRKQKVYQNIQNVVVKLYSKDNKTESVLVNCHFDSVFTSPGTSDDGLNCMVMLDVLRILSKVNYPLKRNVVFLFNGAEEDGLEGSHSFITNHKLSKEVVCFVNLDAGGAGGRPMLYQTGPNAYILPKIYTQSVPYPSANVLIEGPIHSDDNPSDTDFSNFRDYGKYKGMDFAQYDNAYVYHTRKDNISMVTPGVLQVAGDNLLALVKALVNYENLTQEIDANQDPAIYFDVFGTAMICYSLTTSIFINVFVAVVSLVSIVFRSSRIFKGKSIKVIWRHVVIDMTFLILGIVAIKFVLCLLVKYLESQNATMLWYSNQWFVFTYYAAAVYLVMSSMIKLRHTFVISELDEEQEVHVFVSIIQIVITAVLIQNTLNGDRKSYLYVASLLGVSLSNYILSINKLKPKKSRGKLIVYFVINLLPALFLASVFITFVSAMIPMSGRMGAAFSPEATLASSTELGVLLTLAFLIPLVLFVEEFWMVQYVFIALYMLQIFSVMSGFLAPFSDSAMQRFYVMHVNRRLAHVDGLKNETSGFLIQPNDKLASETLSKTFPNLTFHQLKDTDECTRELFCGLPLLYAPFFMLQRLSFWSPSEPPVIPSDKYLNCDVQNAGDDFKVINLTLNGSKFMDLIILPLNGAILCEWSLDNTKPSDELKWNDQPSYFIRFHQGTLNQTALSFSMKFDVSKMENKNDHLFKLAWSVHRYSNTTDSFTPQFRNLIEGFPSWSNAAPMVVDYEEYLLPEGKKNL